MSAVVVIESEPATEPPAEAERLGEKRCWEQLGFASCLRWLNFTCGIGANAAREHLRVARALVRLPGISADNGALGSTSQAHWHAGEEMDLEYAVWVMCIADERHSGDSHRPE